MTQEKLDEHVRLHGMWLRGEDGGKRIDLRFCDLIGSHLSGSDLRYCDLINCNLSGSNLSGSDLRGSDLSGSDLSGSNLRGSDLRGSNLRGSNMRCCNMSGINLSGSSLQQCTGVKFAQCAWSGHGECGRQLLAVEIAGSLRFFCGCFQGTEKELRDYISKGEDKYKASRRRALNFILGCFPKKRNKGETK